MRLFKKKQINYFVSFFYRDGEGTGYGNAVIDVDSRVRDNRALNLLTHNMKKQLEKQEVIILNIEKL